MTNIEYLEEFFRKHNLSGRIKVSYLNQQGDDEYMSDIEFDNGEKVNINDIRFDIDSELESDVFEQWIQARKKAGITYPDWLASDNHYMPQNVDKSSMEEFKKEMEDIIDDVKKSIDTVFELEDTPVEGE